MGSIGEGMELDAIVPSTSTSKKTNDVDPAQVEKGISEARALAAQGQRDGAVEKLLNLEQKCRLAEDVASTRDCCSAILEVRLLWGLRMQLERPGSLRPGVTGILLIHRFCTRHGTGHRCRTRCSSSASGGASCVKLLSA